MKLLKKAWKLDLNRIEEGYLYSPFIVYAENRNKAKSLMLKDIEYENISLYNTDEEVNYLTIPVIRCPGADIYDFEGKELTAYEISKVKEKRKRLESLYFLHQDEKVQYCYIKKRGEYYRQNKCGYTGFIEKAGVYLKKEAISCVKSCDELTLIPVNIERHNSLILKQIKELKERLI